MEYGIGGIQCAIPELLPEVVLVYVAAECQAVEVVLLEVVVESVDDQKILVTTLVERRRDVAADESGPTGNYETLGH